MGEVQLRGPWVAASYYNLPAENDKWTPDGWFRTSDVGTINAEGYLRIVDRTKDLIKSGGEWISSVDLENALLAHPKIREAAVIAVAHPKWQERPVAVVVAQRGSALSSQALREFPVAEVRKMAVARCVCVCGGVAAYVYGETIEGRTEAPLSGLEVGRLAAAD